MRCFLIFFESIIKLQKYTLIFVLMFLVSCGMAVDVEPTEESLRTRVDSRWQALLGRDFKSAYGYFSPAKKKLYPLVAYLDSTVNSGSVKWLGVKVKDVRLDGRVAEVALFVRYKLSLPVPDINEDVGVVEDVLVEKWLWSDGQWWYGGK